MRATCENAVDSVARHTESLAARRAKGWPNI